MAQGTPVGSFDAALDQRRMTRAMRADPVDPHLLDRIWRAATKAPSAGFTQGLDLVVLTGPDQTSRYWNATLTAERRERFPWPALLVAPVLAVVCVDPEAYVRRYGAPDKVHTGLGDSAEDWPVPFWFVDGGMAVENMLLTASSVGLGACFFGIFQHEAALARALDIPPSRRLVGSVALGWPDPEQDRASKSTSRPRRDIGDVVHSGGW